MGNKTDLPKSLILIIILLLGVTLYYVYTISVRLERFRQFGNIKINLAQVKKIEPKIDCYIYYDSGDEKTPKRYSIILNPSNILKLEALLDKAIQGSFYKIEIKSYILLDDQKVEVTASPSYIQNPSLYQVNMFMLDVLKTYGIDDFQYKSLLSIKDQVYADKEKFIDDVVNYGKLKRSTWSEENIPNLGIGKKGMNFLSEVHEKNNLLDKEEIEKIINVLENTYEKYLGVK